MSVTVKLPELSPFQKIKVITKVSNSRRVGVLSWEFDIEYYYYMNLFVLIEEKMSK